MTDEQLAGLVRETVANMPNEFDTHELILVLAQGNQRQYLRALDETEGERPFQTFHARIGRTLDSLSSGLSLSGESSRSKDIFGQQSKCKLWTRQ